MASFASLSMPSSADVRSRAGSSASRSRLAEVRVPRDTTPNLIENADEIRRCPMPSSHSALPAGAPCLSWTSPVSERVQDA